MALRQALLTETMRSALCAWPYTQFKKSKKNWKSQVEKNPESAEVTITYHLSYQISSILSNLLKECIHKAGISKAKGRLPDLRF